MKKLLPLLLVFTCICVTAQDDEDKEEQKEGWTLTGKLTLLINQSSFSNWQAGGENNFSGTIGLNYDANYLRGDWSWDNKVIASYGRSKVGNDDSQKTDDRFEINSILGKKARGYWSYSLFLNFKTQFDEGFETVDGEITDKKISQTFSPMFIQIGPGMLWKKSDDLKVNLAPITSKFVIVDSKFTEFDESFGVEVGNTLRYELGFSLSGYYKTEIFKNVTMENLLNLYSNYLEDPQNVDIDYTLNLFLKVNDWLSADFAFQTIYDDNAFQGFQIRQVFGLGFNYVF